MNIERLKAWLPHLANIAVLASIIILIFQVRQNTQAVIAASSTALTDQSIQFFMAGLDNQIISRALYKHGAGEELTGLETAQIMRLQYLNFRVFENAFLQYLRGYYEENEWERYRKIISRNLSDPIVKAMWEGNRGMGFTAEFEREVDNLQRSHLK